MTIFTVLTLCYLHIADVAGLPKIKSFLWPSEVVLILSFYDMKHEYVSTTQNKIPACGRFTTPTSFLSLPTLLFTLQGEAGPI